MKPTRYYSPSIEGIPLKKQFGQHFLRDQSVIDAMIKRVIITPETPILEIGCGDGFLTRSILKTPCKKLLIFEIDPDWAAYVQGMYPDERMTIFQENVLDADMTLLMKDAPWTILANLPYQVTFPIMHIFQKNRYVITEGVVMIQEEVAQKLVQQTGRGYGYVSLYFQHFFEMHLLNKIAPGAFYPPPKVDSRLLYFKPRKDVQHIHEEEKFWKFIKACFAHPRRTLRNNLVHLHNFAIIKEHPLMHMRAQQLRMADFLLLWNELHF